MGLFDFVKDVGEKIFGEAAFGKDKDKEKDNAAGENQGKEKAIADFVAKLNLQVENFKVKVDGETAYISGNAQSREEREKIILAVGNIKGIGKVEEKLTVKEMPAVEGATAVNKPIAAEPKFYTVVTGDSLSKISQKQYGDANKYQAIFEANKPMLVHPDKIYPGQKLRIPELTQ